MEPLARRLIVVGAIAAAGIGAGLALGSFVAGVPERVVTRASAGAAAATFPAGRVSDQTALAPLPATAPQSYSCQGCDAGLHNDMIPGNLSDLAPLPPYQPEPYVPLPPLPPPDARATPPAPLPLAPLAPPKLPSEVSASRPQPTD